MTTPRASQIARRELLGALMSSIAIGALLPTTACTPTPAPSSPRAPRSEPSRDDVAPTPTTLPVAPRVRADRHAVATENASAAESARQILEKGGSAADAAIVALLVGCVAQPSSIGLGGDGFATVWTSAEEGARVVDFRARAPKGLRLRDHVGKHVPPGKAGVMVGVPGLLAGVGELHRIAGKLPLADLFAVAADAAEAGVPLSAYTAQTMAWLRADRGKVSGVVDLFSIDDDPRLPRSVKSAVLAKAFRHLAADGVQSAYRGALAKEVVDVARSAGSAMVGADLSSYEVVTRAPLACTFGGLRLLAPPPPSGGGFLLTQILRMFPVADVVALGELEARAIHVLAEAIRLTHADRIAFVGDPAFTKIDVDATWNDARLAERRARIREDATTMPRFPGVGENGTFHVSVIDERDVAVSVTATLTSAFGARRATPSGVVLNDALLDFSMDDYGIRATTRGGNFPRGGARPASNMTPTIVVDATGPRHVLGASGGYRVPEALLQVLVSCLAFGRPLAEAVAGPRFYVPPSGVLQLDAALAGLGTDLVKRGEVVEAGRAETSAVSALSIDRTGGRTLVAAGDPRKGGVGFVGEGLAPGT